MDIQAFVSVIIPCPNEKEFIGRCVSSVLVNDYPGDKLGILIVGASGKDATKDII